MLFPKADLWKEVDDKDLLVIDAKILAGEEVEVVFFASSLDPIFLVTRDIVLGSLWHSLVWC